MVFACDARADGGVDGAALLRLLGPRAEDAFAPRGAPGVGALVRLPAGVHAADVGLREAAPGIGRLYGPPAQLIAFAGAHPNLTLDVPAPLHLLLDTAGPYVEATAATKRGLDGNGAIVGIADTGLDVTHPDFLDAQGRSRVAWLLDLSQPPRGVHPQLEAKYGTPDGNGNIAYGAVWSLDDIDAAMTAGGGTKLPQDEEGHGTLVASIAAGNGMGGKSRYTGIAPDATLIIARIAAAGSESISNDDLLRGTSFLFDQADAMKRPIVVNLSIGSDFGSHDGNMSWEQALASHVGEAFPGHALVVAAGNSGSIADTPVHQSVRVSDTATMYVAVPTPGSTNGGAQIWVAMHEGASLAVGLDGPDGTWIPPVSPGQTGGKTTDTYSAGIYNGSSATQSPVPPGSLGAVIVWQGQWPAGTYNVTLKGTGTADLFIQGTGDLAAEGAIGFAYGVREGTINLPATSPSIIGVGCTINKTQWTSVDQLQLHLVVPDLDIAGGLPAEDGGVRPPLPGEPCWFSSAGPTLTGLQKPEIMAPGAAIIGALSAQALPGVQASIFTNPSCPTKPGSVEDDTNCQEIDAQHGVSFGTSFSAPIAAGASAVLLQNDPTMTQSDVLAALQGGAHPLRGAAPFPEQASVGEVDVLGAVEAADRMRHPATSLPSLAQSWLSTGVAFFLGDGSTPLQAILELRAAASGQGPAPVADGFAASRLAAYALVDGVAQAGAATLVRRGPGVWVVTVQLPGGLGGSQLTVGATFDGADIVVPRSLPIATDAWTASYPSSAKGSCAMGVPARVGRPWGWIAAASAMIEAARRRRRSLNAPPVPAPSSRSRPASPAAPRASPPAASLPRRSPPAALSLPDGTRSQSGIGGGRSEENDGASAREVSPARSRANLKSTGPTISLIATVAMASARNPSPNIGNSRATTRLRPRARPACETRPDHDHRRSTGGSPAHRVERRDATYVLRARSPASKSATGHICRRSGTSRSAPAVAKNTT